MIVFRSAIYFALAGIVFSGPQQAAIAQLKSGAAIDDYLTDQVRETTVPGTVAMVVNKSDVLYQGAFGMRNVAEDIAMTSDSIFRLASMTKPIAATVIMMLVEEGKLSLDDPISKYIPSLAVRSVIVDFEAETGTYGTRPSVSDMTIRQMLSHSSGLVYPIFSDVFHAIPGGTDNPRTPPDHLLLYDPGTDWSYSGGIAIVGTVAEQIEGVGLDTLMRERLFEPLGMHETSFIVRRSDLDRVVTIHALSPEGEFNEAPNGADVRAEVSGDGGLSSTASDYAKFIQLFLNDGLAPDGTRLLSSSAIVEIARNQLGARTVNLMDEPNPLFARAFPLGAGRDGYGLGFQVTGEHSSETMRAPGSISWAGIYNTEFWIDLERGVGGILLMQSLPFYHPDAIETLQGFEALVYQGF
jgi:CubicO group peptidase (beta-lactamase class C family)